MPEQEYRIGDLVLTAEDFSVGESITMGRALLLLLGRLGTRCFTLVEGQYVPSAAAQQICQIVENGDEARAEVLLTALKAAYDSHVNLEPPPGAMLLKPVP